MTWLYIPSNCAPASGCLEKASEPDWSSWASITEPFATWSGKPLPPPNLSRLWKREPLMRRLSGLTCSPSEASTGAARWIASLPDSLARTSASPAAALGLTGSVPACSSTSSTSPTLAVRGASLWRTSQPSLLPPPPLWTRPKGSLKSARPPESWENWPTAGGTRNGSLFPRPMWEPATGGHGGSALHGDVRWTTPDVCSGARDMSKIDPEAQKRADTKRTTGLPTGARTWATPDCNTSTYSNGRMGPNIREQAANWPSPLGTDGTKGGPNQAGSKGDLMLPSAAAQWPTPNAHDGRRPGADLTSTQGGNLSRDAVVAMNWPTPASRDHKGTDLPSRRGGASLSHAAQTGEFSHSSPQAPAIPDGQESSPAGPGSPLRLNPAFGCWLMGLPCWWTNPGITSCAKSEMVAYRSRLQSHLSSLLGEPDGGQ